MHNTVYKKEEDEVFSFSSVFFVLFSHLFEVYKYLTRCVGKRKAQDVGGMVFVPVGAIEGLRCLVVTENDTKLILFR
jgi:hypothetical protein